jgi:hypothetical protein
VTAVHTDYAKLTGFYGYRGTGAVRNGHPGAASVLNYKGGHCNFPSLVRDLVLTLSPAAVLAGQAVNS